MVVDRWGAASRGKESIRRTIRDRDCDQPEAAFGNVPRVLG